jgi:crotonobetainyl-CoA:carnitine CoA-transferase CaiB-like acyl-CoA transferase
MEILNGIRVVEFATDIAGPYCGKVFADAGADVIKVELAAGDPLRQRGSGRRQGEDGALFRFLNAGKRSVVYAPDDPEFKELLGTADLFIESLGTATFDYAALRAEFPSLVIVALSPFGTTGPYAGRPATSFTVEAESGSMSTRGRLDQAPIQVGGRIYDWLLGAYASVAGLAALYGAQESGAGEFVDCSLMEVCHTGGCGSEVLQYQLAGRPPIEGPIRSVELPSIERTSDGWVGVNTNSRQQFESFMAMIDRLDVLDEDESWAMAATRQDRMHEWNGIVSAWTTHHSTAEIVELASLLRIPVAPVNTGKTVLDHPHFKERGIWATSADGEFQHPVPPYAIDGQRPGPAGSAPTLGEHQGKVGPVARKRAEQSSSPGQLPLSGLRVVDATAWWAGPACAQTLAALGAEVVHIESIQHPDGIRMAAGTFADLPLWWERSALYLRSNTNKRDLTLNLRSDEGKDLLWKLIERADVIVENFSPRVFDGFGLSWEAVQARNPNLIMVRMPAFGLDGPWRDNVGFAQTMEQMTGMAWVTGYESDQPRIPRGPCDPMAGMSAAFATLLGLVRRSQAGSGSFIEVAMVESALNAAAEQVIEYTAYGNVPSRMGNRAPDAAPQGLYEGDFAEERLALSIATDDQWAALKEVLGQPAWSADPRLDTHAGREEMHDMVDANLAKWAKEQRVADAVEALVAEGIPAATVWDARLMPQHPQVVARHFFEEVTHPVVGPHLVGRQPFRYASVDRWSHTASPTLGQHNEEILAEDLSLDSEMIDRLAESGVIGSEPSGL